MDLGKIKIKGETAFKKYHTRYYYVVYHWSMRGGVSGVGACTISNTCSEFLIGSVTRDIAKNIGGRSVAIASWTEISERQSRDYMDYYESTKAEPAAIIEEIIRSKLNLKFESDPFKIKEWLEKPRPQWLMMDANELIKIGDASRVLEVLEEEE